jgi:hypothetical protein
VKTKRTIALPSPSRVSQPQLVKLNFIDDMVDREMTASNLRNMPAQSSILTWYGDPQRQTQMENYDDPQRQFSF